MRRFVAPWLVALAGALVLAAGCGGRGATPTTRPTPRHVVIVTIDTLRADRLGAYGNTTVPTPNFDRLAREGALASDASAHVPITRPSHASIFTGRYPAEHGLRDNVSLPLAKDVPTLADVLTGAGFTTAAFVSSFVLSKQSGLHRGFSHYDDDFTASTGEVRLLSAVQRRGDDTVARVEQWLAGRTETARAARTALWVHLYDPHDPYEPPEPFASQFADRPYDGEVAWTDSVLGRLRTSLEAHDLWSDALVVVTADHGEALGEHDETGHGFFVYETTLRVPFVMRGPGIAAGTAIGGTVRSIDLMPTVLDLLGLGDKTPALTGSSVSANVSSPGATPATTTYAESLTPLTSYQWSDLRVLREGPWKYILAPRPELYDLANDPGELKNVAAAEPARARALRAALEGHLRAERERALNDAAAPPALSADVLQKLGALGYVSPGGTNAGGAQGADPKDKIGEFRRLSSLMRDGLTLLSERQFAPAAAKLAELQREGAAGFQVHFYRGRALMGLGKAREAEEEFTRAATAMPNFADAHLGIADARVARKDLRGALQALERGHAAAPNEPSLHDREAQLWQQLGDAPKALAAYEEVMRLAPNDALARWRAGELLIGQHQPDRALNLFREATTLDPAVGDYWNSLGMVLGGDGQNAEAARAFRQAIERDPKNARYAYNLGLVLMRDRVPEAADWFRKTLTLDPAFRPARDRLTELAR
ncbi:MAG TPA: sulfatase-like hydrolase/transferase [Vicinamibacterales bacterium]|nr:sulfatase-like hydrolase/transferase [Vicinamibacterales bacterium]